MTVFLPLSLIGLLEYNSNALDDTFTRDYFMLLTSENYMDYGGEKLKKKEKTKD